MVQNLISRNKIKVSFNFEFFSNVLTKKTNIFRKGRRQCVTGLVVNQKVSVPRPIRKRLRAAVHNACMNKPIHWHGKPMNIHELKGRLAFLNQAHHEEAKLLISKLAKNKLV